ncbi:hypothetical protein LENED_005981 [Lentinula edodes]|uniref:Uncharacterized protein n=1 Tax=Lentinula edodes TaxID=5353 RepID=A0A1Q3EAE8_LENED|nr:hypothetical protein LENED_005981 [Lentinula edodes]
MSGLSPIAPWPRFITWQTEAVVQGSDEQLYYLSSSRPRLRYPGRSGRSGIRRTEQQVKESKNLFDRGK